MARNSDWTQSAPVSSSETFDWWMMPQACSAVEGVLQPDQEASLSPMAAGLSVARTRQV